MSDCIFCKIIAGEIPSATIYENDEFKVILDRFPSGEGHALILPKNPVPNVFEIDPAQAGRAYALAAKLARAMKEVLGFTDMNILQNNGPIAGQTVFHFHIHLIPRRKGDGINVTRLTGSEDNDGFVQKDGIISKTSNHAGGIMGGMSDGSDIILRAHIKPTPSISQSQSTVTNTGENLELEIKGRHDPVIVPRAVVVVEAMAALTITDALFNNMSARMDRIHEFYQR